MEIKKLSSHYTVKPLTESDIDAVYELSKGNPQFYKFCPPFVAHDSILKDMRALPPKKTYDDKYYLGFWDSERLIAVLDLIVHFPDDKTAFIGLFMLDILVQGKGIGSLIFGEIANALKKTGYSYIRLGYAKGNPQSEHFWRKNGFSDTWIEYENDGYTVVVLQKAL